MLILLVIAASMEGTIDRASAGHPHGGDSTHEFAAFDPHDHAVSEDGGDESLESHCEHCCHGHSSGIASAASDRPLDLPRSCAEIDYDDRIKALALAPPTPPPNA